MNKGGYGKSPYGNIILESKKDVDEFIAEPDALNEAFIRPMTNDYSGSMLLLSYFLNVNILDDSLVVKSNYAQIDNADSFGVPTQFLEPKFSSSVSVIKQSEGRRGSRSNSRYCRVFFGLILSKHESI